MKRNKLPPTISLEFLLNEVKEQKGKKIKYIDSGSDEIPQIAQKDILKNSEMCGGMGGMEARLQQYIQ